MANSNRILIPLQHWIQEYLPDAEGRKQNTIQSYKDSWRLVIKYFSKEGIKAEDITFEMLTYSRLMGFLTWLEKERGCKVATRNSRLAAISKFAHYSVNQDFEAAATFHKAIARLPFKKNADSIERAYFQHEELQVLLDCATPKDNMGLRDHVLLQYMYATGERAEEVCITRVKDIQFLPDGKASVTIHGKGGKSRRIRVFKEPAACIRKYILHRRIGNQPDAFVFPSQRNARMSLKCVEEIYKKYITLAKRERPDLFRAESYPPHSMRHTTAMHMLSAGVPLVVVKQFLGHAHLSTTEIYAKLLPEDVNSKLMNWSREYWNNYISETNVVDENTMGKSDMIPDFLK